MKEKVIYLTAFFIICFGFLQKSSSAYSKDCKITSEHALERAKELCKKEKITYDSVLGPYFVLPHSNESKPGYLVYFAKTEMIIGECWIDAYGIGNDACFPRRTIRVNDLLLDSTEIKEWFHLEKEVKVIFIQLVSPAKFWGSKLIPHFPAVWWVIDENGDCYYITLTGERISFRGLAKLRYIKEERVKVITDDFEAPFLVPTKAREKFQSETGLGVISIELVSPKNVSELSSIKHLPAVWYIIDENGDSYYMTLTGEINKL